MSKVKLSFANKKFLYLYSTGVENMFINEFMPAAPGDFVKVYLYGLMMVQNDMELDLDEMKQSLGLTADELFRAWDYWGRLGVVKIACDEEAKEIFEIEFINLPEYYYGRRLGGNETKTADVSGQSEEAKADDVLADLPEGTDFGEESEFIDEELDFDEDEFDDDEFEDDEFENEPAERYSDKDQERMNRIVNEVIRDLYNQYEQATGRTVSKKEIQRITEAIKLYNISPDVMSYAIKYCVEIEKYSIDYIFKVAMRWTEEGCRDISQVKEQLDKYSKRNANYALVFREMGFTRLPNPSDKAMMDKWFDEMGFSIAEVIDACRASAGLREPTLKYVNRVLENKILESGGINTRPKTGYSAYNKPATNGYQQGNNSGGYQSNTQSSSEDVFAKVSNKVLDEYYEFIRNDAERVQNAHIDEVCSKIDSIRTIFELENKMNIEMLSGELMMASKERRDSLRAQRKELENDKRIILQENGYPEDYLDRKYKCNECGDTGITNEGRNCVCKRARAEEAYKWYQTIKKN